MSFATHAFAACIALLLLAGCVGPNQPPSGGAPANGDGDTHTGKGDSTRRRASDDNRVYPLDSLPTSTVKIGEHTLRVWVARDRDPQRPAVVQEGLMFVPEEEIEDDQGMLFVFANEAVRGFWMRNTITPLDIAFARANGEIVKIWQMPPLTLRNFSSVEPAMFALEVKQGTLARLGVVEGDVLEVPQQARTGR